jgi:hypothetical protein
MELDELLLSLADDLKALGAPETVRTAFDEDIPGFTGYFGEGVKIVRDEDGNGRLTGEEGQLDDEGDDRIRESFGKILYLSCNCSEVASVVVRVATEFLLLITSSKCLVALVALAVLTEEGDSLLTERTGGPVLEKNMDETVKVDDLLLRIPKTTS